jgi:hypothetical protein
MFKLTTINPSAYFELCGGNGTGGTSTAFLTTGNTSDLWLERCQASACTNGVVITSTGTYTDMSIRGFVADGCVNGLIFTITGAALGAIAIAALGFSLPKSERHHVTASFFVCAIAACAYLAMATGVGTVMMHGEAVFFARYADWVFTTPLLLLGLLTEAEPGNPDSQRSAFK